MYLLYVSLRGQLDLDIIADSSSPGFILFLLDLGLDFLLVDTPVCRHHLTECDVLEHMF